MINDGRVVAGSSSIIIIMVVGCKLKALEDVINFDLFIFLGEGFC
jgi:hypothetical protein